jgi:cobalt/nickel transport system permease protein
VLIMLISSDGFLFPLTVLSICLGSCIAIKAPLRMVIKRFAEPGLIAVVIVILKTLFSGHETLVSLNMAGLDIVIHGDGLAEGLMIASKIMGAVSVIVLLGFSASHASLIAALAWFRVPRLFIEILSLAYRYIFVLFDEAAVIYSAQKNRLGYVSWRRGVNSIGILAGSMTLKAFDHSQNITTSMIQRGYDGSLPPFSHRPFRASEVTVSFIFIIALGCVWTI